jgi:hypothetical protein
MRRTATNETRKRPTPGSGALPERAKAGSEQRPQARRATADTGTGTGLPKVPAVERGAAAGEPAPDYQQLFKELVARANAGEREALARLRKFLDANPHIWSRAGDLTAVAERAWIELIAGEDQFRVESVKRRLTQLKDELKGPHPTALEAVLVDLIAVAWLGAHHVEIEAASPAGGSLAQAAFKLRRAESSQKRLLAATKTRATLRALVPRGLVPARPLWLHDPGQKLG